MEPTSLKMEIVLKEQSKKENKVEELIIMQMAICIKVIG